MRTAKRASGFFLFVVFSSLLFLSSRSLMGQTRGMDAETDFLGGTIRGSAGQTPAVVTQPRGVALEAVIDPDLYYVGPSDVFLVNVWISPPVNFQLTVTPEGTLVVPSVGEVKVAGLTLSEAKKTVAAAVRRKYLSGEVGVTLLAPRPIIVTVTGNVLNPGSYEMAAYNRADRAIEFANRPQRVQTAQDAQYFVATASSRNVQIQHRDGGASHADISRFHATNDGRMNPYLREGDIVVVPKVDFGRNVIGIYGEVNAPGRHEYVRGDSVRGALQMAYGFTALSVPDSTKLVRSDFLNTKLTSEIINAGAILKGTAPDIALKPGDRIVVPGRPELRADYNVTVSGEVLHPGTYPITRNFTRLSEVVRAAGGLTEFAWVENAELIRRSVQPSEMSLERLESLRGGASAEDSSYYYMETDLRLQKEIVNVDFKRLFLQQDSSQDVILQDGDAIRVPSLKKTIYVFGQVVSPGNVPFIDGQNVGYYVGKAGGLTDRAREGDIKIVKAKTRQWLSPEETSIEAGDYVWIPKEPERSFGYYMNIIGQTASVVSVAISLAILVIQAKK